MSTQPPPEPPPSSWTVRTPGPAARLPLPVNAELVVFVLVEAMFAVVWAASDAVDAGTFVTVSAVVTLGYLLSRGIAKASRVYER
jgi:hypothetical protein